MRRLCLSALPCLMLAAVPPALAQQTAAPAIDGFRSATFGMKEAEVKKAIRTDFKTDPKKIGSARNLVEKTTLLAIRVDDMVPDSGAASVVYTLGYKSKGLIQVTVQFGRPLDKKVTPKALWATARVLQGALVANGIDRKNVLVNKATKDRRAIVLYQGTDTKGRMALLTAFFEPETKATKPSDKIDINRLQTVRLQYMQNPKAPDVYKPKKGDF